jgi:3-oxoacyl-[acyl-carrier protein] reductase
MKANVVIAGAGKGIGLELTKWFLNSECNVIAISRNTSQLKIKPNLKTIKADITEPEVIRNKVNSILSSLPDTDIHIYVYNAGLLINKPFLDLSNEEILKMTSVNFLAASLTTQSLIPWLLEAKKAHVVFIGSMGGFQGSIRFSGLSVYSATKSALASLSESLAEEFKYTNISFNTLALGAVDTKMLQIAFPEYKAKTSPESIASFIGSFALTQSVHFNGKVIPVAQNNP